MRGHRSATGRCRERGSSPVGAGGAHRVEPARLKSNRRSKPYRRELADTLMNADRLTTKSREVVTASVAAATQHGHPTVEPWHLLLALLDTGGSTAGALLRAVGANPADIRRAAART